MSNTDEAGSPLEHDASGLQDDSSRPSASKDRQCPFCHTPFTSSSLGRHLDLYIKEKNPKPPDGVHDVDKIRQMRGKITRRHPKGSTAAARSAAMGRGHEQSPTGAQPGLADSKIRSDAPFDDAMVGTRLLSPPSAARASSMNRLHWQATGVINDLPPTQDQPFGASQPPSKNAPYAKPSDPGEGASAAEIALHDLVKNLQRAAARIQRPGPFDYDVFSLNFPAMCLKLLPTPPTLFSTTPSHSNTSWPIDPPDVQHLELVKAAIKKRLKAFMQVCPPLGIRMCNSRAEAEAMIASAVEEEFGKYEDHTNCVHAQWQELSAEARAQVWQLELMRALAKLINDMSDLSMKFHRAQDQYESARAELDRLHAKLGRDDARRLNHTPHVSNQMLEEAADIGADPEAWQYQTILDRYRDAFPGLSAEARARPLNGEGGFSRNYFSAADHDAGDIDMGENVVGGRDSGS